MSAPENASRDTSAVALAAAAENYVLRRGRSASGETAKRLGAFWIRLAAFIRARGGDPAHPTAEDASAFIADYSQRYFAAHPGLKRANPYTLNTYTAYAKDYFRNFRIPIVEDDWLAHQRTTPRSAALSGADVRAILDFVRAEDEETTHPGPEARIRHPVLYTLAHTGVRRAELVALRLRDLRESESELFIFQGKGGKDRSVVVARGVFDVLSAHLARHPVSGPDERVFRTSDDTVERIVRNAGKALGLRTHPHLLRHTYATALRERGVDERYVAAQLGHLPPTVTGRVYDHVTPERARSVLLPVLERLYDPIPASG